MSENAELFYIQHRGACGKCLLWWRPRGDGFTMNLDNAWKVDRETAEAICRRRDRRGENFMWPISEVDAVAVRHVNSKSFEKQGQKQLVGQMEVVNG